MISWYAPVYLAGIQTGILILALFQAYTNRKTSEKEILLMLVLVFASICMFIAVLTLFNLTLAIPELTIVMKRIDAVWY